MTQPNIEDAVQFAIAQSGKPYRLSGRFGLDAYDCSGLVIRSLSEAHIPIPAKWISVGNYGNTVSLYKWAKEVGGLVPVSVGVATRGAVMIKGRWYGNGPLGHTSFSLGDGREMAAHGRRTGIGVNVMNAGFYQDAFIIPGVNYGPIVPPAPSISQERSMIIQTEHYDPSGQPRDIPDIIPKDEPGAGERCTPTIGPSADGRALVLTQGASFEGAGKPHYADDIWQSPDFAAHGPILSTAQYKPADGPQKILVIRHADNHIVRKRLT